MVQPALAEGLPVIIDIRRPGLVVAALEGFAPSATGG